MSMLSLSLPEICHVAELLLGAAHADGEFDGHEAEAIGEILRQLVPDATLPVEVTGHLAQFDVDDLDVTQTARELRSMSEQERLAILNLVVRVVDADQVHDMREDDYIERVAIALGVDAKHYEQFIVEIIEITPPPLPPQ